MNTLNEGARLWRLGMAVLWLHPRDKRPIGTKWTTGPRKDWKELKAQYRPGMNMGVRLGLPSKLPGGYLACIDVDVKDPAFKVIALKTARKALGDLNPPMVSSGGGNGSRHYYGVTKSPFKQLVLGKGESLGKGKGRTWEVVAYSTGRQMVLPPSTHPRGADYIWVRDLTLKNGLLNLPKFHFEYPEEDEESSEKSVDRKSVLEDFEVTPVKKSRLETSISVTTLEGLLTGAGVSDRSAFLLPLTRSLHAAEFTKNEILTILTDPDFFMGRVGYDHAKTKSRKRAAEWIWKFSASKVFDERDAKKVFENVEVIDRELPEAEAKKQSAEFEKERHWTQDLAKAGKGKGYKPSFLNAVKILENEFGTALFHKDDFSLRRTYGINTPWGGQVGYEISDEDVTAMRRYVGEKYHVELEEKHIISAITSISSRNHKHPVREYLDSLEWDGESRLDFWLRDYAGVEADPLYLETISRKVICAMVKRAYFPGAKFDYVLILEGPNQGEGKSRSIRALASPDWAGTVRFDMDHKDFVLALQGRWITEISELSGLGKKNTAFVKAIVSEEADRIRHPYGRFTETLPRQGIFIGTTNHFHYLEDETGNRRFWPVRVGSKVDVEGIAKIRDQLFAEAKFCLEMGEVLYIEDPKAEKLAREVQSSRMTEDSWEEKIKTYLDAHLEFGVSGFKISKLFEDTGPLDKSIDSEANLRRIGRVLRKLKYTPRTSRLENGEPGRFWFKS